MPASASTTLGRTRRSGRGNGLDGHRAARSEAVRARGRGAAGAVPHVVAGARASRRDHLSRLAGASCARSCAARIAGVLVELHPPTTRHLSRAFNRGDEPQGAAPRRVDGAARADPAEGEARPGSDRSALRGAGRARAAGGELLDAVRKWPTGVYAPGTRSRTRARGRARRATRLGRHPRPGLRLELLVDDPRDRTASTAAACSSSTRPVPCGRRRKSCFPPSRSAWRAGDSGAFDASLGPPA